MVAAYKGHGGASDGIVGMAGIDQHATGDSDLALEISGGVVQIIVAAAVYVWRGAGVGGAVSLLEFVVTRSPRIVNSGHCCISGIVGPCKRGEAFRVAAAEADVMFYAVLIDMRMVYTIREVGCYSCACSERRKEQW